ncbi:hypothetical protein MHYP_G00196150 [Metynnis hypsauchen]
MCRVAKRELTLEEQLRGALGGTVGPGTRRLVLLGALGSTVKPSPGWLVLPGGLGGAEVTSSLGVTKRH